MTITQLPSGTWQLDTSATTVTVSVKKLGFFAVPATLDVSSGSIEIDDDHQVTNVDIVVDASSYASKNAKRNEHVLGPDFLDTKNHPTDRVPDRASHVRCRRLHVERDRHRQGAVLADRRDDLRCRGQRHERIVHRSCHRRPERGRCRKDARVHRRSRPAADRRREGGNERMTDNRKEQQITVAPGGPYIVSGNVSVTSKAPIVSEHGEPLTWRTDAADEPKAKVVLCRCGSSSSKPYCDGTHASPRMGRHRQRTSGHLRRAGQELRR